MFYTPSVAVSWFTEAPMVPRAAATVLMAFVIVCKAVAASPEVDRSSPFNPKDVAERAAIEVPRVAVPPAVPSLV